MNSSWFKRPWVLGVICLLLWPVSIFVCSQLGTTIGTLLWWLAMQSGGTSRPAFDFRLHFWLLLAIADGTVLGLVPFSRLRELFLSTSGALRRPAPDPAAGPPRLLRWIWLMPTLAFAVRFALYDTGRDHSVLSTAVSVRSPRLEHFFALPVGSSLDPLVLLSYFDKTFFTAPMLFTLCYVAAAALRHRLPSLQHQPPLPADTLGS